MPSTLGPFIRQRREQLGLSQMQLARRMDDRSYQSMISRLEGGQIALPGWRRLAALAAALGVSAADLLRHAGVIEPAVLPVSGRAADARPRGVIHHPIGVIREWETAAVFSGT
jgi:transcriptional regulator with XRE-family HTH domain